MLRLVVGLGNPGRRYAGTRHNAGFLAVEELARRLGARWRRQGEAEEALAAVETATGGARLLLLRPLTYMNASGEAVRAAMRAHRLGPKDLLVVHDDLDLPLGRLRLRPKGSSGGHRGILSCIERLGTSEFARLKLGIGRPPEGIGVIEFVLEEFGREEQEVAGRMAAEAAEVALCWAVEGMEAAMNRYNRRGPERGEAR